MRGLAITAAAVLLSARELTGERPYTAALTRELLLQ